MVNLTAVVWVTVLLCPAGGGKQMLKNRSLLGWNLTFPAQAASENQWESVSRAHSLVSVTTVSCTFLKHYIKIPAKEPKNKSLLKMCNDKILFTTDTTAAALVSSIAAMTSVLMKRQSGDCISDSTVFVTLSTILDGLACLLLRSSIFNIYEV